MQNIQMTQMPKPQSDEEVQQNENEKIISQPECINSNESQGLQNNVVEIKNFQKMSTNSILDNQYFMEDSIVDQRMEELINPDQYFRLQKYCLQWKWNQFLEFFFYNFIQMFLLGPIAFILLYKCTGKYLLANSAFLACHLAYLFNSMIQLLFLFCNISYFISSPKNSIPAELIQLWIFLLFKCIAVAAPYGTYPKEKIKLIKTHYLSAKIKYQDSFRFFYNNQSLEVIYLEGWSCFKLHEFDQALFYINFFILPPQKTNEQINEYCIELESYHQLHEEFMPEPLCQSFDCNFFGFGILAKLIKEFEKSSKFWIMEVIALVLSIIVSLMPLVYLIIQDYQFNLSPFEMTRYVVTLIMNIYLSHNAFIFLLLGIRDLQRKLYLAIQCAHLISPKRKDHYMAKKVLPTINIIHPASIKAWSMLRIICFDYGKQFHLRTKLFYSVYILFVFGSIIFLLLALFNIIKVQGITLLYVGLYTLIFFIFIVIMLVLYAEINWHFNEYENLLQDLKSIFIDMLRMKNYYFVKKIVPKNYLHKKFVEQFRIMMKNDCSKLDFYLDSVRIAYDDAIRNLEYDSRNSVLNYFQIPITYELLGKMTVAIGTIFGVAIESYIQTRKSEI